MTASQGRPLLRIEGLKTWFGSGNDVSRAVDGVSFDIPRGRTVALVGESGCGKSVTARSILRLVPAGGRIESGAILYEREGERVDLAALDPRGRTMRSIRGREISMIFQEPMTSLNPVFTIGSQIAEGIRLHEGASATDARERAIEMLEAVAIPAPRERIDAYPHELSGGMRQRAMIGMALACNPSLLIADEPTTALDVTVQAQVLRLMRDLQRQLGTAILFITHDLGVVAGVADEVLVMYLGELVERASVRDLLLRPKHPYTQGLMSSLPTLGAPRKTRLPVIEGSVPPPGAIPSGCRFHPRCPQRIDACAERAPALQPVADGHDVACHLYEPVQS